MPALWRRVRPAPAATLPPSEPLSSLEAIVLQPIGVVRSSVTDPRRALLDDTVSAIVLEERHRPALRGLEGFSHIIVLTWLDRVSDDERSLQQEHPSGDRSLGPFGVLALRTHHRPNPIGVTVVALARMEGAVLTVHGLDAVDGTPVLDLKPYLPPYDCVPEARLPAWAGGAR